MTQMWLPPSPAQVVTGYMAAELPWLLGSEWPSRVHNQEDLEQRGAAGWG